MYVLFTIFVPAPSIWKILLLQTILFFSLYLFLPLVKNHIATSEWIFQHSNIL